MFRKKENRDTLLLIFMAAAFIGFLAYLFLPQKITPVKNPTNNTQTKSNQQKEKNHQKKIKFKNDAQKSDINSILSQEEALIQGINLRLKEALNTLFIRCTKGEMPFVNFKAPQLTGLLEELNQKIASPSLKDHLKKLCNVSFFELYDYFFGYFSLQEMEDFKFNLYLALFLTKINLEDTLSKICDLPENKVVPLLQLEFYQLLGNEVQEDYQLFPVLVFYYVLLEKVDILVPGELCPLLNKELKEIRDFTPAKFLLKIRESLELYREKDQFIINWIEEDGISSDDKGSYKNQELEIIHFLNQKFIIFDFKKRGKDPWIVELCDADSGEIELVDLEIFNQSPSKNQSVQRIYYARNSSRFVVFLDQEFLSSSGILAMLVRERVNRYFSNYNKIEFGSKESNIEQFKADLKEFGNYLKSVYQN